VGDSPTSKNGMLVSKGIKQFKEDKIFYTASERCVSIEREALKKRKKKIAGRLGTQKKKHNDKCSYKSLRDSVLV
jgi:hypothetical protein